MKFEESIYTFLKALKNYDYEISVLDQIWELIFPDNKSRWNHLRVTKYKKVYYLFHIDGKSCSLEVIPGKSINVMNSFGFSSYEDGSDYPERVWGPMIKTAITWLKKSAKTG